MMHVQLDGPCMCNITVIHLHVHFGVVHMCVHAYVMVVCWHVLHVITGCLMNVSCMCSNEHIHLHVHFVYVHMCVIHSWLHVHAISNEV